MRILHIVSRMNPKLGGVSQAINIIIGSLRNSIIDNDIVCFDPPDSAFLETIELTIFPLGPTTTPWLYSSLFSNWLAVNINKYDHLIIHGLWQYHSYCTYKIWNKLPAHERPSLFVMPHGMLDPWFQRSPQRRLKAIRNFFYWKFIEQKLINNATGLLFTCKSELILARETFLPYKPISEIVVGLGTIEPPKKSQILDNAFASYYKNFGTPYFLFLGRIDSKKGLDILIQEYLTLIDKNNEIPNLVIAGPGLESEFGQSIYKLAKYCDKITFTGMLSGDSKWGALFNCEAFILPSHQENFGISVVEALSCSIPVLISNQVNIWDEVFDAKAGFIAPDTHEGVFDLLSQWINLSNFEKESMRENALSLYRQQFTLDIVGKKFSSVFTN